MYHSRVHKDSPIVALFEEGQDERHSGGTQENENQLVLELLQNQFPHGSRRIFRQGWRRSC